MNEARKDKQKVLEAAGLLFGRNGYASISLEDVADFADLEKQTVMRHCLSKEDLLFQVLRQEVSALVAEAEEALAPDLEPQQLLERVSLDAFAIEERRPLVKALMLGRLDEHVPTWKERLHELRQRCLAVPIQMLQHGMDAGLMRRDLPVDLLAQLLFELHAMGLFRTEAQGGDSGKRRRQVAIEIVLRGLRARGGDRPAPSRAAPPAPRAPSPPRPFAALPGLLEASRRVLVAHGFAGFTLARAATGTGLKDEDVEAHFPGTEELLLALLAEEVEEILSDLQDKIGAPGSTDERLRRISERSFRLLQERPLLVQLFRGDAAEALPEKEEELGALRARLEGVALPVLTDGVAKGELRADLPLPEVSALLLELHMAGYLIHYRPGPDLQLRAMQRRVAALDFLMDGLLMH